MIDSLLPEHSTAYGSANHRFLVDGRQYERIRGKLSNYWGSAGIIPHPHSRIPQQAKWCWLRKPLAESYWPELDIVYCPAESYVPTKQGRLVCTIHDVAPFEDSLYPDTRERRLQRLKWKVLINRMAKDAAAVVTVSDFSASRIRHFFPELGEKLCVIHNAPHKVFHSPADEGCRSRIQAITEGCPYVLLPGGLSFRKNADLVLDALPSLFEALPDIKLVVAGSSGSACLDRLDAMGEAPVKVVGYVSDADLNALYRNAIVVWFPSRYEGFGMPPLEAMTAGAPVVASRSSSLPEVLGDAAILCDVDDAAGHVDAISSVFNSIDGRDELCRRSKEQAALFSWRSSAERLEMLFQKLLTKA